MSRLQFTETLPAHVDKDAKTMFEGFVQECKESDVQLIFVTSPVYYRYVEMCPDWSQYLEWYDSIAQSNGITYLNFMEHSICTDSTMFNAGVHLTPQGTKNWSEMLSNDLIEKQIIEK